ncbi:MAG: pilus assembly protein TadG-related protein [Bacillota bacterium]
MRESGQVGIALAVWIFVLLLVMALALDAGRAVMLRSRVSDAADAAALAGASTGVTVYEVDAFGAVYSKSVSLAPDLAREAALDCLGRNMERVPDAELLEASVEVDRAQRTVLVRARARVGTYLLGALGPSWRWLETCVVSVAEALPR